MANRDGFTSGLLFGAIVGGVAGTILGVTLATRRDDAEALPPAEGPSRPARRRSIAGTGAETRIEQARQGLESKIAQLNDAIDDVRRQLGGPVASPAAATNSAPSVNGRQPSDHDLSTTPKAGDARA